MFFDSSTSRLVSVGLANLKTRTLFTLEFVYHIASETCRAFLLINTTIWVYIAFENFLIQSIKPFVIVLARILWYDKSESHFVCNE